MLRSQGKAGRSGDRRADGPVQQRKAPLGRTEWIKLYGAILNEDEKASELFEQQVRYLNETNTVDTGKTVAFFHISSSGYAVARKSTDYVSKMIELAGGEYVFRDLGDPETATSTVNLEMETFLPRPRMRIISFTTAPLAARSTPWKIWWPKMRFWRR